MTKRLLVLALAISCGCRPPSRPESAWRTQSARVRSLDPVRASDVASALAVSRIYEGLVQYSWADRPYRLEPLLAESLPEISPDGRTYVFRLRAGIFFADDPCFRETCGRGRELVADDFVYSFKRLADPRTGSTGYWILRGYVEGLDDFRRAALEKPRTDYDEDVPGLQALSRYEFCLRLTRPHPQLLWALTMPYAVAVPREAVEFYGPAFDQHPVGTGPYILKSFQPNYRVEFAVNPKWRETHRREWGEGLPRVAHLIQYIVGDPATAWLMFLSGQLDVAPVSRDNWSAVFDARGEIAEALRTRGIRVETAPALDVAYIGFNMDDPILGANRALRQALACAFDFEQWAAFYGARVAKADGPVPPALGLPARANPHTFDLDRARSLLAEAGYPGGRDPATGRRLVLTLEVGQAENPEVRQSTELLVQMMDRIGVVIEPRYYNWPTFLERLERRQAQMFRLAWLADYPDAENFLQLFYGPNASPGPNRSNYSNREFDALYERAQTLPSVEDRMGLYDQMVRLVQEDAPWIFLHHSRTFVVVQPWVEEYRYHDFPWGMDKYYALRPRGP